MRQIFQPVKARPLESGAVQKLYRFPNGYGASVVKGAHTYGGDEGLWELAVIVYNRDEEDYQLTYETPITTDVEGHLDDDAVEELLTKIMQLPLRQGGLNNAANKKAHKLDNSLHIEPDHNDGAHGKDV